MKSQRQLQVAEEIRRNIAEIFIENDIFQNPNIHTTIRQVDVSADIKNAKIQLEIFTEKKEDKINGKEQKIIDQLNQSIIFFKKQLSRKIKLKYIPKISFILDKSNISSLKINQLIDQESRKIHNQNDNHNWKFTTKISNIIQ